MTLMDAFRTMPGPCVFGFAWCRQSLRAFAKSPRRSRRACGPSGTTARPSRQHRRFEQRPALVEHRDRWLAGLAGSPLRHRLRDQHAHRRFEPRVRTEALDVEEQPVGVRAHGCVAVEQLRVDSLFSRPLPQRHRRQLRFVRCGCARSDPRRSNSQAHRADPNSRDWIRYRVAARLYTSADRIGQHVVEQRCVGPGRDRRSCAG